MSEEATLGKDGILYIGCRDCLDSGPSRLQIIATSPHYLWGFWENPVNTGQMSLSDAKTGRALPNPAGTFCAFPDK